MFNIVFIQVNMEEINMKNNYLIVYFAISRVNAKVVKF